MKQMKRVLWMVLALAGTVSYAKDYKLASPDGNIVLTLETGEGLSYDVSYKGKLLMDDSRLSLTTDYGTLGRSPKVKRVRKDSKDEWVDAFNYRADGFREAYNELRLSFKGNYELLLRAYDSGVAYRWITDIDGNLIVKEEQADFRFAGNFKAYLPYSPAGKDNPYCSSFQNVYEYAPLDRSRTDMPAMLPSTVDCGGGTKVTLLESDLEAYPGMFVRPVEGKRTLKGEFAAYPSGFKPTSPRAMTVVTGREDCIAKVEGKRAFPWRIMAITEKDTDMPVNHLVYALASPNRTGDFSWVKGGKAAWEWWNDWGISRVDFKAGINTETYKYYIDFAAENGLEFVVLDEGWYNPGSGDMLTTVPEINLPELVAYGKSKGVKLILWTVFNVLDSQREEACRKYSEMGIAGFKVDFLNRDDQTAVEMVYRIAEAAAKYYLTLDLHGFYKPTGLNRTYPNIINFESVFGMEEVKWSTIEKDMMEYDVVMPYIRMMAGPLDYTPGAMRNASKNNFKPIYSNPLSQGTRCHQLAAYIVHDSPLTMLADNPTAYLSEQECTDFISSLPNVGIDETKVLQGKIGEYIIMARKVGDNWYVGGMTDWNGRTVELDFSFLGEGDYQCISFTDGVNADRQASDYVKTVGTVDAQTRKTVRMAPGGGFALALIKR